MISRQLVSSPFFTHTLCGHSVHLLGSSFGLRYSLRPRLITQMQDIEPTLPNPDVFSLQHAPPQFYGLDPSVSHHTSASILHSYSFKYIHNYPARLLAQRRISRAQPSCSPNRPPPLSIYPLRPHLLPSTLLFYPYTQQDPKTFSLLFTPHHHPRCLTPVLHITHIQRKAPMHSLQPSWRDSRIQTNDG